LNKSDNNSTFSLKKKSKRNHGSSFNFKKERGSGCEEMVGFEVRPTPPVPTTTILYSRVLPSDIFREIKKEMNEWKWNKSQKE
jgi:hypothetical protein